MILIMDYYHYNKKQGFPTKQRHEAVPNGTKLHKFVVVSVVVSYL